MLFSGVSDRIYERIPNGISTLMGPRAILYCHGDTASRCASSHALASTSIGWVENSCVVSSAPRSAGIAMRRSVYFFVEIMVYSAIAINKRNICIGLPEPERKDNTARKISRNLKFLCVKIITMEKRSIV